MLIYILFVVNCILVRALPFYDKAGIVGGHEISITQAPYMVSISCKNYFFCGGTIVHEKFILTAAHCFKETKKVGVIRRKYFVRAGADSATSGGVKYEVTKVICNSKFHSVTSGNDICLLKLEKNIRGPKTAKVRLAGMKFTIPDNASLETTGWGRIKENGSLARKLRQVSVPIVPRSQCIKEYQPYYPFMRIPPFTICAGGHGKDSCEGDSGGPLTYKGVQVGIVSFGIGCAAEPGVYTNIAVYQNWIKKSIMLNTDK